MASNPALGFPTFLKSAETGARALRLSSLCALINTFIYASQCSGCCNFSLLLLLSRSEYNIHFARKMMGQCELLGNWMSEEVIQFFMMQGSCLQGIYYPGREKRRVQSNSLEKNKNLHASLHRSHHKTIVIWLCQGICRWRELKSRVVYFSSNVPSLYPSVEVPSKQWSCLQWSPQCAQHNAQPAADAQ